MMQAEPKPIPYLRVLYVAAEDPGRRRNQLDLQAEHRELQNVLDGRLMASPAAVPDDVVRSVRSRSPTVVHFSCHGDAHSIEMREGHHVTDEHLCRFFAGRGVELVVFNTCFSEPMARRLVQEGAVRAVIGTTCALGDLAARSFSRTFYWCLCEGHTIRQALTDAKDSVKMEGLADVFKHEGDVDRFFADCTARDAVVAVPPRPPGRAGRRGLMALLLAGMAILGGYLWLAGRVVSPAANVLMILSPAPDGTVEEMEPVTFASPHTQLSHYIVVVPLRSPARWIVDGPLRVDDRGRGSGHARFGTSGLGAGEPFSLTVIATKANLPHGEHQSIDAEHESAPVRVTRARQEK
jgi:hypothetical protein